MPPSKVDAATLWRWLNLIKVGAVTDAGMDRQTRMVHGRSLEAELHEAWLADIREEAHGG